LIYNKKMSYAKIIILDAINKHIDQEYTYGIPKSIINQIDIGMRVIIPFGRQNKNTRGIIVDITSQTEISERKLKYILEPDKQDVFINKNYIKLAKWMSEKYFTPLGLCLRLLIPNKKSHTSFDLEQNKKLIINSQARKKLTSEQINAISFIKQDLINSKSVLLHGVTGSGKTEVYFNLLENNIAQNKQAIVLLPEIALTTQMIKLFLEKFKNQVGITHSRLTPREKFIQWQLAAQNKILIMLGPRSAVFTPFENLGLIIMDEEHESCYFSETAPKYNTREVAEKICELTHAKLILGSATPSIESYYLAQEKKINLIEMPTRVNKKMPEIKIIDMRKELLSGNINIFSRELIQEIYNALDRKEQVILFLNRRGYSNFVSCLNCGFVLKCSACDVNYTYHAYNNNLVCHYCGEKSSLPKLCPSCNSKYIKTFGVGTQKVELEIKKIFSRANILRMDSDTVTKKTDYEKILKAFANHEADILVGTQMIAKGLDFPCVSVVGIISADISLNSGDFRCAENTFQLITQVAGRAGRAHIDGTAFIQTYNPEHYAITCAQTGDYKNFYSQEIIFRKNMNYPPFTNIFCVLMTSPDEVLLIKKIILLKEIFLKCDKKSQFDILGPSPAMISKLKNNFRQKILLKHPDENYLKKFVLFCVDYFKTHDDLANIKFNLSLNPICML